MAGGATGVTKTNKEMSISFPGGRKVTATFGDFEVVTDQSVKNGGDASAPEPYDLFLASLATCAGIYVLGFCAKRDLPTDGLKVTQRWTRDEKSRRLETISIDIETGPDFPEKYLGALERAASQCAVKKTMLDPPEFEVTARLG
jgi:putative redox protein